jgi:polyhydroxyalkanoate synthesis regulator protein
MTNAQTLTAERHPGEYVLRRCGNRRLYDYVQKRYVRLVDVVKLVMRGEPFIVLDDDKSDATKEILFSILSMCEANTATPILPVADLKKLIIESSSGISDLKLKHLQSPTPSPAAASAKEKRTGTA